jgi:hypothetical protein
MKKLLLCVAFASIILAGCKKEETSTLDPARPDDQMHLTATPAGPITLSEVQADAVALSFTWAQAKDRGQGTSITYRFQLSVQGRSTVWEEAPAAAVKSRSVSFTHGALSALLTESLGATPGEPATLEAKVVAEVTASIQMQPEVSIVTVTVTPYGEKKNINGHELTQEGDNEHLFSVDINLTQNEILTVGGMDISDWWIDPDFFNKTAENTLTFLPIAGKYRIIANTERKYFKVQVLKGSATAYLEQDGTGAIWATGQDWGDPTLANRTEWDFSNDFCLAPIGNKQYKLSGVAGQRFKTNVLGIKFTANHGNGDHAIRRPDIDPSHQDAADPRYEASFSNDYIKIDDGDNVHLKNGWTLQEGATYTFILDVSGGYQNIQLHIFENGEELKDDPSPAQIGLTINDVPMTKAGIGGNLYSAEVNLAQGQPVLIGGDMVMEVFTTWWIDPDYIRIEIMGGQPVPMFIPITGKYRVTANLDLKYFMIEAMNSDGTDLATLQINGSGAIWVIGDGVGKPSAANDNNWLCMAPIVLTQTSAQYRITLKAGETLNAGNFDIKFYYQKRIEDWGGEFIDGSTAQDFSRVGLATSSSLVEVVEGGHVKLKSGQTFEAGASYTFTIEMATVLSTGKATLIVEKQ